jgi:hypothetical protein
MRLLGVMVVASVGALGCGDDSGPGGDAGGGSDAGPGIDGGGDDAGPPAAFDAGPPPSCDLATFSTAFATAFGGERDAELEALVAVAPDGPFAFGWRSATGVGASRTTRVEVALLDGAGTEVGNARLGEVSEAMTRLGQIALAPAGGGVFVAWEHATTDMDGRITAAEIRHAGLGADGSVGRAEAMLYAGSATPFVAADPPDDLWMLRSELDFMGTTTGVLPRIQHLDAAGTPSGEDVSANSFIRVEATEVKLAPRGTGLVLAYRVAPSTALVVPLDRTPIPASPERRVFDVPFVDDVAALEDAIAIAWNETAGGVARLGVVVTSGAGTLRARVELDSFDADYEAHVAVVRAWPGFVAIWRAGAGDEARLRAAGIDPYGTVVVPPTDLAAVAGLDGDVLAVSDGTVLTVGYRLSPGDTMGSLGMTRACVPGTSP